MCYFVGKDLSAFPQMVIGPLLYTLIYVTMSACLGDSMKLYLVIFGTTYASYALGYILSILVPPSLSQARFSANTECQARTTPHSPTRTHARAEGDNSTHTTHTTARLWPTCRSAVSWLSSASPHSTRPSPRSPNYGTPTGL